MKEGKGMRGTLQKKKTQKNSQSLEKIKSRGRVESLIMISKGMEK